MWRSNKDSESSGQVHNVPLALATSNIWQKSHYFYLRWELWIRHLIDSNRSCSAWNLKFFLTQWRNVVREMLMNVLLELWMQLVHLWCSQAMCIGRDFWMFVTQHTPLQPDMVYLLICWCRVPWSSSEGRANYRESRLYCNHLWWVDALVSTLQMRWRQSSMTLDHRR
jgi:hypothetical protein